MEDPTEEIQKQLHERAHNGHDSGLLKIALSSAIIAVLAAIASLLSEHQINEAMLAQLKSSDQWSYYQAKGIKRNVLESQVQILSLLGKPAEAQKATWEKALDQYKKEQDEISQEATREQNDSVRAFQAHNTLSYSVTFLQVAIGLSAVSALTRRRWLWIASLLTAVCGLGLLSWGFVQGFRLA